MKLYLMQHGDALDKSIDPDRPLSKSGRANIDRMARFLAKQLRVSRVLHSGKTRARQTAEVFSKQISRNTTCEPTTGIAPNDSVEAFTAQLTDWDEDLLVVGHLPFMNKLVSYLVAGTSSANLAAYQPGTMVCLESRQGDQWQIQWMVRPALLPDTD